MLLKEGGFYSISNDIIEARVLNKKLEIKDKESYLLSLKIIGRLLSKGLDCGNIHMYFKERKDISGKVYYGFYEGEYKVLDAYINENMYSYYIDTIEVYNIIVGLREEYNGDYLETVVWDKVCNLN